MKKIITSWIILTSLVTGCTSSKITLSWKQENAAIKKYNKILVIAMNGENDLTTRQRMEIHLTRDLKELGYNAVSTMQQFGPRAFRDIGEQDVIDKIQHLGFDAVLTIALLDKEKDRVYVPRRIVYTPYPIVYYRQFWGYYTTIYDRVYAPGYYTVNTKYFWETNLYDISSKELLYSVQTESFDPPSSETLGHEYGKLIVKDMVKSRVLTKQEAIAKDVH